MKGFRVFVGCIPGNTQTAELTDLLSTHASVSGIKLAMDKNSVNRDYCLGYGFAVCPTKDDVEALLKQSNNICYRGRYITLREYKVGSKLREDKKKFNLRRLFVGNIPRNVQSYELRELFGRFGEIENIYTVDHEVEQSYKYGYVVFYTEKAASIALKEKLNIYIHNSKLRVEYFSGKKSTNEQTTIKTASIFPKNSNNENINCPESFDSIGMITSMDCLQQISTTLGATASSPAQINRNTNEVRDEPFKKGAICPVLMHPTQVDNNSLWRKRLFQRNKTCSLETDFHFDVRNNGGDIFPEVELEAVYQNPSNNFQNPKLTDGKNRPYLFDLFQQGNDPYTGRVYLSLAQIAKVVENHSADNMRVKRQRNTFLQRNL